MVDPIAPTSPRNKQPFIIDAVTQLAQQLGPGMKLPTVQDLSRQLGVTIATLDRSLKTLESRGVINRKQGSGIYVAKRPAQKTIGLVFGVNIFDAGISPIYSILLRYCEKRASDLEERFSIFLGSPSLSGNRSGESPLHHDLEEAIENNKLDGLLLFAKSSGYQEDYLRERKVPMVALTAHSEWPGVVRLDSEGLIRNSIKALRKQGCRSIAFFSALPEHTDVFRKQMKKANLPVEEAWIFSPDPNDPNFSVHQGLFGRENYGRQWAAALASGNKKKLPDGLICTDDMITRSACPVFEGAGLRIGRTLKLATQANIGSLVLAEWSSELIQFAFDPKETVDAMFATLEAQMNGAADFKDPLISARRC